MTSDDEYWSVDIPGLTEAQARELLEHVEAVAMGTWGKGYALDPKSHFVRSFDDTTVEACLELLQRTSSDNDDLAGLREDMEDWLKAPRGK